VVLSEVGKLCDYDLRLAVAAAPQMWIHECDRRCMDPISYTHMCTAKCYRLDTGSRATLSQKFNPSQRTAAEGCDRNKATHPSIIPSHSPASFSDGDDIVLFPLQFSWMTFPPKSEAVRGVGSRRTSGPKGSEAGRRSECGRKTCCQSKTAIRCSNTHRI